MLCQFPGCDRPRMYRRWCQAHYLQLKKNGIQHPIGDTPPGKLWTKIDFTGVCWEWLGDTAVNGYGRFTETRDGQTIRHFAHRRVYAELVGDLPDGVTIDHLCRNHRCVNPDHLEPVTSVTNVLRGYGPSAINARKTTCVKGHDLTPRQDGRGRRCITCDREAARRSYERRKAA